MIFLSEELYFPPVNAADKDGLLAIGGDLKPDRLLLAYRSGIFPWYENDTPILWWCPDPRFVLFPQNLKVSRSMRSVLSGNRFRFTMNRSFKDVIRNCKTIYREGQDGTWITDTVVSAYTQLHKMGYAHSAETWENGKLVGGLYGIRLGKIFFGESMFSFQSNASKFAFINYIQHLSQEGIVLIDCQVYTEHLESLGAEMISRDEFISLLEEYCIR